jgi:aminoglycoside phosphotransferase (APT) family kinase protein
MDSRGIQSGPITGVERITGGTQNILLRFGRGDREFVLRRPADHSKSSSARSIDRETRILRALGSTSVPHPSLVDVCLDEEVLGTAFYLMDPVDGFNPRWHLPAPHRDSRQLRRRMGLALVDSLAELGSLDVTGLGLGDLGRSEGFLERQTGRWMAQLEGYRRFDRWPGPADLGDLGVLVSWLDANLPPASTPGIFHGDFHLSNVLYRHDSAEIAAIVDWELSTVGEPLLDLGWLIATWPDPDGTQRPGVIGTEPWDGFPTAEELQARYAERTDRDLEHLRWFVVLACLKLAVILEGTYARTCDGQDEDQTGARLHAGAKALIERGRGLVG